ncbi:MAG: hypothetical protein M3N68_03180 [Actinomycetota bacterium]|nr:hypothetical protein [Actinomycetota bacterium]
MRRLATQFDDPWSPGGVATPSCCCANACCSCCCCVGTLLTASTVSAMRLYDAGTDRGRRPPARIAVAAGGALLFPALVPFGIWVHNADVSDETLLLVPLVALGALLVLWPLSGARGVAAVLTPLVIWFVTTLLFVAEVLVAGFLVLSGGWPLYLLLVLAMAVGAAFFQHSRRARR